MCRYPKRHQHEHLAEYCYKIKVEVTSKSKLTRVDTGEKIATVLSALMNSGGGVLVIHLVTKTGDIHLATCQEDIVNLITKQERWIPEDMFSDNIVCTKNEGEQELYFFVSKTSQLLTHHSKCTLHEAKLPRTYCRSRCTEGHT